MTPKVIQSSDERWRQIHSLIIMSISDDGYWGLCRNCQAEIWVSVDDTVDLTPSDPCMRFKGMNPFVTA